MIDAASPFGSVMSYNVALLKYFTYIITYYVSFIK